MRKVHLRGLYPAVVCPFGEDGGIDEEALGRQVGRLLDVEGVSGIVCNGHAGEVTALTGAERSQVVRRVRRVAGQETVIVGIASEATHEAVDLSLAAREAGADAVLLFPPFTFGWGASAQPSIPLSFVETVAREADLPIVLFQYPLWTGCTYPADLLARLVRIDQVVGVKEAVWEMQRYEEDLRTLRQARADVAILAASDTLLFPSFALGADGALVGLANVAAELIAGLFRSVEQGDLFQARALNRQLYPLTRVIYRQPIINMHVRIKEMMQVLGWLPSAAVRPPLLPLTDEEREMVRAALEEAGLATPTS